MTSEEMRWSLHVYWPLAVALFVYVACCPPVYGWVSPTSRPRVIFVNDTVTIMELECRRPMGFGNWDLRWEGHSCLRSGNERIRYESHKNETMVMLRLNRTSDGLLGRYNCLLKERGTSRVVLVEKVWISRRIEISLTRSGIHCHFREGRTDRPQFSLFLNGSLRRISETGQRAVFPIDFESLGRYVYTCVAKIGSCRERSDELVVESMDLTPEMRRRRSSSFAEDLCLQQIDVPREGNNVVLYLYSCHDNRTTEISAYFDRHGNVCGHVPPIIDWTYYVFRFTVGHVHVVRDLPTVDRIWETSYRIGCRLSRSVSSGTLVLVNLQGYVCCEMRFNAGEEITVAYEHWRVETFVDGQSPVLMCDHPRPMWEKTICIYSVGMNGLGTCRVTRSSDIVPIFLPTVPLPFPSPRRPVMISICGCFLGCVMVVMVTLLFRVGVRLIEFLMFGDL